MGISTPSHNLENLKCILIDHGFPSTQSRKQTEIKWIIKPKNHIRGLTTDTGSLRTYEYFQNPDTQVTTQGIHSVFQAPPTVRLK